LFFTDLYFIISILYPMRLFISDEMIKAYEKNNHVLSNTCEKDSWEDNSGADADFPCTFSPLKEQG